MGREQSGPDAASVISTGHRNMGRGWRKRGEMLWGRHLCRAQAAREMHRRQKRKYSHCKGKGGKRKLGLCQEQAEASGERGLGRETELERTLSEGFMLRVWAEEAVRLRQMLCPDGLPVPQARWLGQGEAACSQHRGTGLSAFVVPLKLL